MEFRQAQLDNGLTVIAEINPSAASMAAGFFVRTGSRDETPSVAGVSHFLEHMMFKGTARRSAFDVNRDFDRMGAHYNAFTSEENTVYYASVLPEFQTQVLDLLGDILRPALRQDDFDMEKNVILDEIARYEDQPRYRAYEKLMASFFAGHPLGNSVLGTPDSIRALTRDHMQDYFDRRYSPTNVVVVGVGNLDFDAFVEKAAQMCSHWTPYDAPRAVAPCLGSARREAIRDEKLTRQVVGLMSPAPASQSPQRFAAHLLSAILGDDSGSRLYYALIEPALADEASMSYDPMDGAGGFITFLSCDPKRAAQVAAIAREEYRKFLDDGATEKELVAAKNKIAASATLKGELPMGRLTAVGFDWVYRRQYVPLKEQVAQLFAVTRDEALTLARQCDILSLTTLTLGPLETLEA